MPKFKNTECHRIADAIERWTSVAQQVADDGIDTMQISHHDASEFLSEGLAISNFAARHLPHLNTASITRLSRYIDLKSRWRDFDDDAAETAAYEAMHVVTGIRSYVLDSVITDGSADLPPLTVADKAVQAIRDAAPRWITAATIGQNIGKTPKSVRAALSRRYPDGSGAPYESVTSGANLGYRWNS